VKVPPAPRATDVEFKADTLAAILPLELDEEEEDLLEPLAIESHILIFTQI
jgi:hypothetical protein